MNAAAPSCPTCGAVPQVGAVECAYCHRSIVWEGAAPPTPSRSVEAAATAWGRSIFGAPRNLGQLVESVAVKDEVLERLFTTVVRRDVQEVRGRGPSGRQTPVRLDARQVDPFAISTEQLREASQHVTACAACGGAGTSVCRACGGVGRARCGNCNGSGQERRHYKKSSRLVKCSVCRGGGTVVCGGCGARGTVGCDGCGATGNQLAWLTYGQTTRSMLFVTDSPIVAGHRQLGEDRNLGLSELGAFGVMTKVEASSALAAGGDVPSEVLRLHLNAVDGRLERVTSQQYIKIAVVRRDATFEMCACSGTLVLSGSELVGSTQPSALRPIRRRQVLWALAFGGVFLAGVFIIVGRPALPYFWTSNRWILLLTFGGMGLSIPAIGVLLRQLRRGFRFRRLSSLERAIVGAAAFAFAAALLIVKLSQPRVSEIKSALAAQDLARARVVLNALLSSEVRGPEVLAAEDAVEIAEAASQPTAAKLDLLDGVAARKGTRAGEAARLARQERLAVISAHIADSKPTAALNAIGLWYPAGSKPDAEVSELRAKAEQQVLAACSDPICKFTAANRANEAAPTAARAAQLADVKRDLLGLLALPEIPGEPLTARLGRLGALAVVGKAAVEAATGDSEVATAAEKAVTLAKGERSRVALMGLQEAAVVELLGALTRKTDTISYVEPDSRGTYIVFDAQRRCRGIYLVGAAPSPRTVPDNFAVAVLSQAVGHPASLKLPTGSSNLSRWVESGVAVVGRWRSTGLVELRIGDAAP